MEFEKASVGLMSPPLAGGRGSEREMILAWAVDRRALQVPRDGLRLPSPRWLRWGRPIAELENISACGRGIRCSRKTLSSALMRFAGAWSKSKTSFAVQDAATRKMQFPVPVPADILNVLRAKTQRPKPSWNCQQKRPSKQASLRSGVLQKLCHGLQDFLRKLLVRYRASHANPARARNKSELRALL